MKTIYKVVRTYDDGAYESDLQCAFDDDWQFVRASSYVPETTHGSVRRYGYIEYILSKEMEDEREGEA